MSLSPALHDALLGLATTTIATLLAKTGRRSCRMHGPRPLAGAAARVVGPAFTLRFIPARDAQDRPDPTEPTRMAIEAMPAGAVVIAGIGGQTGAGILGDVPAEILAASMAERAVAGLVTDGAVRNGAGVLEAGLAVWANGIADRLFGADLVLVGRQEAVACGGVAVMPDDIVVADGDGVVVVPAALAEDIARQRPGHGHLDAWILSDVGRGIPLPDLQMPDPAAQACRTTGK